MFFSQSLTVKVNVPKKRGKKIVWHIFLLIIIILTF